MLRDSLLEPRVLRACRSESARALRIAARMTRSCGASGSTASALAKASAASSHLPSRLQASARARSAASSACRAAQQAANHSKAWPGARSFHAATARLSQTSGTAAKIRKSDKSAPHRQRSRPAASAKPQAGQVYMVTRPSFSRQAYRRPRNPEVADFPNALRNSANVTKYQSRIWLMASGALGWIRLSNSAASSNCCSTAA